MAESVQGYYNRIGAEYDEDRFGASSYGQYIHRQECAFFNRWLPENPTHPVLDMGCGTGRFMSRATDGVDFSEGMLAQAKLKYPAKQFHFGEITATNLPENQFEKAFSMHVMMHLDEPTTRQFLVEAHRILQPNGLLIVDFPSAKRRSFGQRKVTNWHGSNALNTSDLMAFGDGKWEIVKSRGILFFPIHRFPVSMRKAVQVVDNWFCRSFMKSYSSYLIVVLRKL